MLEGNIKQKQKGNKEKKNNTILKSKLFFLHN